MLSPAETLTWKNQVLSPESAPNFTFPTQFATVKVLVIHAGPAFHINFPLESYPSC